jgi:hypothetical protein
VVPPTATGPAAATTAAAPATATTTAATAAAVPAVFDVSAEFERTVQAQTPGFSLQAAALKPRLRIGHDELSFTVQSERDGYLYVLAHGSDGLLTLLYPNTTSGAVKLRKGQSIKLPQAPLVFETTEPAGPAQLLVLVSERERDHSLLQPRKDGPFRQFPTGDEALRRIAANPGPLPLLAGRAICPGGAACADVFGAAVIRVETVR